MYLIEVYELTGELDGPMGGPFRAFLPVVWWLWGGTFMAVAYAITERP